MNLNNHTVLLTKYAEDEMKARQYRKLAAWCVIISLAIAAMMYAMVMVTYLHNWTQADIMFELFLCLPIAAMLILAAFVVVTEVN